jgi:hypothetical protein
MERLGLIFAAALVSFTLVPPAMAQMEIQKTIITSPATTRVEKTVVTSPSTSFILPGTSYVVVDTSGKLFGKYTTTMTIPETGKVIATVGSGNTLVALSSSPALVGDRVFVQSGSVLYLPTSFAAKRALIDQKIGVEYDAGRLTNEQVKDLRDQLTRIANLEIKKTKNGTISDSNSRKIDRQLNELSADLTESIADTNRKRADLGIKVN